MIVVIRILTIESVMIKMIIKMMMIIIKLVIIITMVKSRW